jgi:hypothetical protein
MNKHLGHAFIALAALSLTAPAFAGDPKQDKGASEYAPGQTKPSDQSAKEYAPGQSEGAAKQAAPGQQLKKEDSTGSSSSGSSTGTGSSGGSTGSGSRY